MTLTLPPDVLPCDASYMLVCTRNSSIESGAGTATELKLLLPRLLASIPLITRLFMVPRWPLTNTVVDARPTVDAFGIVDAVPALYPSRFVKLRVDNGRLSTIDPGSTVPAVAFETLICGASLTTEISTVSAPTANCTGTFATSVTCT